MKRHPICIADAYHDFIIDKIDRRDNIEYEKEIKMMIDNNFILTIGCIF